MLHQHIRHFCIDLVPSGNHVVVTLVVAHLTEVIHLGDVLDFLVTLGDNARFLVRNQNIIQVKGQTATECLVVTKVLDVVQELCRTSHTASLNHLRDNRLNGTFLHHHVLVADLGGDILIYQYTTRRGLYNVIYRLAVHDIVETNFHLCVDIHTTLVECNDRLLGGVENQALTTNAGALFRDIVQTENHILRRHRDRITIRGVQNIVRTEHQELCLENRFVGQRQVNGHLVTIEVGVESGASQRVQLNSLTLNHLRLESQYTMTVQGRCTVQQYGVSLHYVLQNFVNHRLTAVDNLLGRLNGLDDTALDEFTNDERLIQFRCHLLRKTALVHLQLRTYHDNRTCRIVNTLTKQVLTETTLLTF